jgi:hypothetical protein
VRYSNSNVYDILVDQGATLNRALFIKDPAKRALELTGYTARMHIRDSADSTNIIEILTTENEQVIINELDGRVDILLTPAETEALTSEKYVYDLELESPEGHVIKIISGKLTVRSEITY